MRGSKEGGQQMHHTEEHKSPSRGREHSICCCLSIMSKLTGVELLVFIWYFVELDDLCNSCCCARLLFFWVIVCILLFCILEMVLILFCFV